MGEFGYGCIDIFFYIYMLFIMLICSIIAGNVDNEYEADNYKLMDYLTRERIMKEDALLSIFPVLEIFTYENINNSKMFNDKINEFKKYIGEKPEVIPPSEFIKAKKIDI